MQFDHLLSIPNPKTQNMKYFKIRTLLNANMPQQVENSASDLMGQVAVKTQVH
jgi:hypothetical protein